MRQTSNDLEHALVSFGRLQRLAEKDARTGVAQLRQAILRILFGKVPRDFVRGELAEPLPWATLQEFITATLVGDADRLTPDDLQYPHIDYTRKPTQVV